MFDLSRVYDVKAKTLRDVALRAIGALQKERPEALVAGLATLFVALCERYRVDPRAALEATERVRRGAKDLHPVAMRALNTYLREELPNV